MGRSVDLYCFEAAGLLTALRVWATGSIDHNQDVHVRLHNILSECGTFRDDVYILVNNEFYGDYNPFYNLLELLSSAFPASMKRDVHDVFRDGREWGITSADKEDIAERLGITLEDEE